MSVSDAEVVNKAAEELVRSIYRFLKTRPVTALSVEIAYFICKATIRACAASLLVGISEEDVVREVRTALDNIEKEINDEGKAT